MTPPGSNVGLEGQESVNDVKVVTYRLWKSTPIVYKRGRSRKKFRIKGSAPFRSFAERSPLMPSLELFPGGVLRKVPTLCNDSCSSLKGSRFLWGHVIVRESRPILSCMVALLCCEWWRETPFTTRLSASEDVRLMITCYTVTNAISWSASRLFFFCFFL